MNRRNFLQSTAIAAPLSIGGISAKGLLNGLEPKHTFQMKYAPHLGMFENHAGADPIDQLNFMAEMGFKAFEDNWIGNRPVEEQEKTAKTLGKNGMDMGVFVAHKIYWTEPNLAGGNEEKREEFLSSIKASVEVAKRVNAKWMTVVPGHLDLRREMAYQTQNVVETLKRASEILEPHNLTMVLEPLNFRDHPGLFLSKAAQAYDICKQVGSPSCKILYDIYHQQITEGNLIPNIEASWDEIAYFQIGDNPGRKEPTTGEINYRNVFKYIHSKGFKDILGMEHGNFHEGKEGEEKLIQAYVESDKF